MTLSKMHNLQNLEKKTHLFLLQSLPPLPALPVDPSFDSPAPLFSSLESHATEKTRKHGILLFQKLQQITLSLE